MRGLLMLVALVLLCGLPQAEAKNRNKSKLVRPMLAPTRISICRHAWLRGAGGARQGVLEWGLTAARGVLLRIGWFGTGGASAKGEPAPRAPPTSLSL